MSYLTLLAAVHNKSTHIAMGKKKSTWRKQTNKRPNQLTYLVSGNAQRLKEVETRRGGQRGAASSPAAHQWARRERVRGKTKTTKVARPFSFFFFFFSVDESKILCGARVSLCGMHLNEKRQGPGVHVIVYI